MDRRKFLSIGALSLTGTLVPQTLLHASQPPVYCGWLPPTKNSVEEFIRRTPRPYLSQQVSRRFIGSGKNRIVLLHKYLARALGKEIESHHQKGPDCVGQAYGLGVDILAATQVHALGLRERFISKASTEIIYAGSRYEIGYKVHGNAGILRGGGSRGIYAAEFLRDYGSLVRKQYGDIDLTEYNVGLANEWGRVGIPDQLEPIAKLHPVQSFALMRSYADCRDAIANGYPVIFCSNQGFNPNCRKCNPGGRDADGFLKACGTWYHGMLGLAMDDTKRPGILVQNSWGPDWVGGPTRLFQPPGSFWVEAKTIDYMCQQNDTFAISNFFGFKENLDLDYDLF